VASYQSELTKMAGGRPVEAFALADQSVNTQRSIHLQAVTLWILAALLAGVGALVVAQLLSRQGQLESSEYSSLRAVGVTSMQLWWLGLFRALMIAIAGAVIACGIAVGVSPLLPVGLAGVAEPDPGPMLDGWVLALGGLGTVVAVVLLSAWPAYQRARRGGSMSFATPVSRPSIVMGSLVAAGAPPTVTTGVRLALERGRGSSAVPVRSSIAISALAVLVVVGAVVFTGSLDHLLARPDRYGVLWDAEVITVGSSTEGASAAGDAALRDPQVDAVSEGYTGVPLAIGDVRVSGIAVDDRRGPSLMATVLDGHVPTGTGEVILGTQTMRELHAAIGDSIAIQIAGTPNKPSYTIVGRASFPSLADGLGLGRGVGFTLAGLRATLPEQLTPPADTVLIRFRDGANSSTAFDQLEKEVSSACACQLMRPTKPVDLVNFGRVQYFPVVLGALMAGLGVLVLAHLLVSATRRRRRELAMMLVLGMVPAQVRRAVAWQATTVAVAAALIGVPLGIIGGRFAWTRLADQLGVSTPPLIPVALVLVPLGAIIVANAAALLPARAAVSNHPSRVLRDP
jgi:ABC-type lipoprotein release transport system permease subunit